MKINKKAYAKINLTLDVLCKRNDGYHDIRSIMQTITLADEITMTAKNEAGIGVSWNLNIPPNDKNTAATAAKIMFDRWGLAGGLDIKIKKTIPIQAGLGGGSADAAAVIEGINELYKLGIAREALLEVGALVGADVPFCIQKGTALAEGIGERLIAIDTGMDCSAVVVKPDIGISTRGIFNEIDDAVISERPDTYGAIDDIRNRNLIGLGKKLFNTMEFVCAPKYPIISELKQAMLENGAFGALMSGSGSSVYGLFKRKNVAFGAYKHLQETYERFDVFVCDFYYP